MGGKPIEKSKEERPGKPRSTSPNETKNIYKGPGPPGPPGPPDDDPGKKGPGKQPDDDPGKKGPGKYPGPPGPPDVDPPDPGPPGAPSFRGSTFDDNMSQSNITVAEVPRVSRREADKITVGS